MCKISLLECAEYLLPLFLSLGGFRTTSTKFLLYLSEPAQVLGLSKRIGPAYPRSAALINSKVSVTQDSTELMEHKAGIS